MPDQIICRASSSGVSSAVPKTKTDPDGLLTKPAVEARAGSFDDVMRLRMMVMVIMKHVMMMLLLQAFEQKRYLVGHI